MNYLGIGRGYWGKPCSTSELGNSCGEGWRRGRKLRAPSKPGSLSPHELRNQNSCCYRSRSSREAEALFARGHGCLCGQWDCGVSSQYLKSSPEPITDTRHGTVNLQNVMLNERSRHKGHRLHDSTDITVPEQA